MTTKRDGMFYEVMGHDFTHGVQFALGLVLSLSKHNDMESLVKYLNEEHEIVKQVFDKTFQE